jgi:hypothetical protein
MPNIQHNPISLILRALREKSKQIRDCSRSEKESSGQLIHERHSFLMIGAEFVFTAGLYVNVVPLTLAHLLVTVIMG